MPYVVSFFTSSSEKRSTFTSLWLDVRRASAAVGDRSTGDNVRSPSTRSTCQKSISSLRGRSLPRRFLIPRGTACLRPRCLLPRCLLVEDRGLPFLPSLLQCFPVTSQLFLVESFHLVCQFNKFGHGNVICFLGENWGFRRLSATTIGADFQANTIT